MARPTKCWLDYFPMDVTNSLGLELVEAKYGLTGFALYVKLLQRIYGTHGYYMECDKDAVLLFAKQSGTDYNTAYNIIQALIKRGIFDESKYREYNILTSADIQLNYSEAKKRAGQKILDDYCLINVAQTEVFAEKTGVIAAKTPVNAAKTPIERVKENKEKNILSLTDIPVLKEVQAYCAERNSNIDPETFFDYYTARGWAGISDWKAQVRVWERREKGKKSTDNGIICSGISPRIKPTKFVNYKQPVYSAEEDREVIRRKQARAAAATAAEHLPQGKVTQRDRRSGSCSSSYNR